MHNIAKPDEKPVLHAVFARFAQKKKAAAPATASEANAPVAPAPVADAQAVASVSAGQ